MTRGTAILLMKNYIMSSLEFNGDMYPHGYGDKFINRLSEVNNKEEFKDFTDNFNDYYFQYNVEDTAFEYPNNVMYNEDNIINLVNLSSMFSSDWIFFKNLTGDVVQFKAKHKGSIKVIDLAHGETIRFNYDEFPSQGAHHIKI